MKKVVLYTTALILCAILLSIFTNAALVGIVVGVISSILLLYVDTIASNLENLNYWWISIRHRDTYIRLSMSYLFRIKVEGKYLLVRGARLPQFQPVGGVFKRYTTSNGFFSRIEGLDDNTIPLDQTSKDDLRIRIKGRHLVTFLDWFNSRKEREISCWREFYQELIEPGYLSQDSFPFINYQYVKRHEYPLRYSDPAQSLELLIAEIYELIPTTEQEAFLKQMSTRENSNFIWVDEDRIRRRGAIPKKDLTLNISEHSRLIL